MGINPCRFRLKPGLQTRFTPVFEAFVVPPSGGNAHNENCRVTPATRLTRFLEVLSLAAPVMIGGVMDQLDTPCDKARVRSIVTALLTQHTPVTFAPRGPSMTPLIRDGDSVAVRPVTLDSIRAGHILLYQRHNRLILHRMIRRNRKTGGYLLAADAALSGADHIDGTVILGVATRVTRAGRTRRLDITRARLAGLTRYYTRPIRRLVGLHGHRLTTASDQPSPCGATERHARTVNDCGSL